jgi:delta14-sterol reductase
MRFAVIAFAWWFCICIILTVILPGVDATGVSPYFLTYKINGHLQFWVTLLIFQCFFPKVWPSLESGVDFPQFGAFPLYLLYDNYYALALVTIVFAILFSAYLFIASFINANAVIAKPGSSGNYIYDFFMGRELNPRWFNGTFDLKEFCELKPGLIGWMILNLGMLEKQRMELGYVSGSMVLINIFQGIYVWDALYNERAILTTMDITTDGFGCMLCFGDLAWVPFTYSLQARYLVTHDPGLSNITLFCIALLHAVGYTIFRGANSQKDAFRRDPDSDEVKHLKFIQTKRGTKLLTSGYWGMARKINYTGDWIMGLSWCAVCGFDSIIPYFYVIYFGILLVHRSIRDDHMCAEKYGEDWATYKSLVKYRFIPGVF